MRAITYKNQISRKSRKREVCIEEIVQDSKCLSRTTKRSLYFVKSRRSIESQGDFDVWVKKKQRDVSSKRDFHIMKIRSDKKKSNTVLCKAKGEFYIVSGKEIYNIFFLHSVRMEVMENKQKAG